jgi:branched-chain amino acid aminotransferase
MIVFLDGRFADDADARVSIHDLGFLHGDAVFETARLHRGGYFRLDHHLDRLAASAAMLRIAVPPHDQLASVAEQLAVRNALEEATLRITITRGRPHGEPTVLATLQPISSEWVRRAEHGWRVITAQTRRPGVDSMPAQLKSVGRTYSLLARLEAAPLGADDVLLLSEAGYVCEGPTWSVFWRRGSVLRTPSPDTGVLEGITRAVIIDIAPHNGFSVEQGKWLRSDLDSAEEVFATMSSVGVVPVRALDGRPLPSDAAARLLQARYWDLVAHEVARAAEDRAAREERIVHSRRSSGQH